MHRSGAVVVAVVLVGFGTLGFAGGLAFFSTAGRAIAGLSSDELLSLLALVTAAALIAAAVRGARLASTVMITVGTAFLVSAFANLALLGTALNVFAFRLPTVFFSVGTGLVLLILGGYGRIGSKLPVDNPYYQRRHRDDPPDPDHARSSPATDAEAAADEEMAAAERDVAAHPTGADASTGHARRASRVDGMRHARSHEERRAVWMSQKTDQDPN